LQKRPSFSDTFTTMTCFFMIFNDTLATVAAIITTDVVARNKSSNDTLYNVLDGHTFVL
jgi:hypothetical protein